MFWTSGTEKISDRKLSGFYKDVTSGLKAVNKYLQSKYFYDEAGDKLFQQIMECPEYYPTRCEMEILQQQSGNWVKSFFEYSDCFDLVELGAGDATKSTYLLKELLRAKAKFTYYPIDISSNVIHSLETKLPRQMPGLHMLGLNGEYLDKMEEMNELSTRMKIVLFMGANIGNMTIQQATVFCSRLYELMRPGDLLMIGFDLKKNPRVILDAYNDRQGITRDFNLNLLKRINRELNADFDLSQFDHYPTYDPRTGTCKSYLVSLADQEVQIGDNDRVHLEENETIFMEISQKYTLRETNYLAAQSGFKPIQAFYDSRKWFADILWQRLP
ncbi:L-histidine N(alpha)-methyltransferase [Flavitalea flava]